jgi:hypothetical protein
MLGALLTHYRQTGTLHSAYLVTGRGELWPSLATFLTQVLETSNLATYADLHYSQHETLDLETARALRATQAAGGLGGGPRLFVLEFATITEAAQHALLKTLEEPAARTHFFLLTAEGAKLLPTLRSRCQFITLNPSAETAKNKKAEIYQKFLAAPRAQRLELLKPLLAGEAAEKRATAKRWLAALEEHLATTLPRPLAREWHWPLRELWQTKRHLGEDAAVSRLLLEHLALILPIAKPVVSYK